MTDRSTSPFQAALARVGDFSDKEVAVLPEKPGAEMLKYIAQLTGEDADKLGRLYAYFISVGRLDGYAQLPETGYGGFAEEK